MMLGFAIPVMAQVETTLTGLVDTVTPGVDFVLDVDGTLYNVVPADLTVLDGLVVGDFVMVTGMLETLNITDATVVVGVPGTWSGAVAAVGATTFDLDVAGTVFTVTPPAGFILADLHMGDLVDVEGWLFDMDIYASSITTVEVYIEIEGEVTSLVPLMVDAAGEVYTIDPGTLDLSLVDVGKMVRVKGTTPDFVIIHASSIQVKVEYVGTVTGLAGSDFLFTPKGSADVLTVTPTDGYIAMEGDVVIVTGWQEGDMIVDASVEVLFKGDGSDLVKQGHFCTMLDDTHPVAQRLAEENGMYYEQVMSWFCVGNFGFGEIKNAFKAGTMLDGDHTVAEILAMKEEMGGWGKVKQELGLIGKDKNKPGDEESASIQAQEKSNNKPDNPPGNPDHQTGPPEHANNNKDKNKDKD
jgi:hypothetical protein